jgi:glycosyltransferase involved in cell wall biosynthesis
MKILMLSWRDLKNPKKGGAEIVTDIYLKGLVKKGYEVVLFSAMFKGAKEEESYNGYKIIRHGSQGTVWYHGLKYAKQNEKMFDKIIDQVNTIPFLTPLRIKKEKRVAFIHQLCKNIWFYEKSFPVSIIGYILELIYLKFYKNTKTFVVSDSTKNDLIKHAWAKENNILVLENQIGFKPIKKPKNKEDYFVFVGRLTRSKRVEDCVKALSYVNCEKIKLYIVGDGDKDYKKRLEWLISDLGLDKRVVFCGEVIEEERNKIMQKARAVLVTSVREGWGLIVTEANANGTIAITYNIEGLKDANKTGFITKKKNTPKELSELMKVTLDKRNNSLLNEMSEESLAFAREHSDWNKNIGRLEEWLRR